MFKEMFLNESSGVLLWIEPAQCINGPKEVFAKTDKILKGKYSNAYIGKDGNKYYENADVDQGIIKKLEDITDFEQAAKDLCGSISNYGFQAQENGKWYRYDISKQSINTNLGGSRKQPGK